MSSRQRDSFNAAVLESRDGMDNASTRQVVRQHGGQEPSRINGPEFFESAGTAANENERAPESPAAGASETEKSDRNIGAVFEKFQGREFRPINVTEEVPVNQYLRRERRSEYVSECTGNLVLGKGEAETDDELSRSEALGKLGRLAQESRRGVLLETPLERVTRLQSEVVEVVKFMQEFLDSRLQQDTGKPVAALPSKSEKADVAKTIAARYKELSKASLQEARAFFSTDPVALLSELSVLESQLDAVYSALSVPRVDAVGAPAGKVKTKVIAEAGSITSGNINDTAQQILLHLDRVQKLVPQKNGKSGSPDGAGKFSYEVYLTPGVKSLDRSVQISALERRLAEVEGVLGLDKNAHLTLPYADIATCVNDVVRKLVLLHPGRLEQLGKRIDAVKSDLTELIQKKEQLRVLQERTGGGQTSGPTKAPGAAPETASVLQTVTESLDDRRLNDLYDLLVRWKSIAGCLPVVIQRLKLLKHLHQEAAGAATRLANLETQQSELSRLVTETSKEFEDFKKTFSDNMSWLRSVVGTLSPNSTSEET